MADRALIIFVKNPIKGKVKTRIAKEAGDEKALHIYQKLLEYTRKICLKVNAKRYLYYSDFVADDNWSENHFIKCAQTGSNLGERMQLAFKDVLKDNGSCVIIGSDCIQLTPNIIEGAFDKLSGKDVVIGPSLDGGYYLIGMKELHNDLFRDIAWSTSRVFTQTLAAIESQDLEYDALEQLGDIDYYDDWLKFGGILLSLDQIDPTYNDDEAS